MTSAIGSSSDLDWSSVTLMTTSLRHWVGVTSAVVSEPSVGLYYVTANQRVAAQNTATAARYAALAASQCSAAADVARDAARDITALNNSSLASVAELAQLALSRAREIAEKRKEKKMTFNKQPSENESEQSQK
eukprot:TRINITY_DN29834_c0_g1_i1.p1 TRINITY_DN29834_c0_g1~~TRINITY_DN29834_c0_g1_i1.p1  ORF type:complete len:134 (-),score=37.66 TRINITY_DN29834_c0_g1_i1:77-478(-)